MGRILEVLVDEDDAAARAQHASDLGDTADGVDPVVHRVDRPDRVDGAVIDRELLGRSVHDGDVMPRPLEHASSAQCAPHEGGRLDRNHVGAGAGSDDDAGTHTGTDVDDAFAASWIDELDDRVVHVRTPHPRREPEVAQRAPDALIVGVPVPVPVPVLVIVLVPVTVLVLVL